MTNDLNLITMTTNLESSLHAIESVAKCVWEGGNAREVGREEKCFSALLLTLLLFASDFLQMTVVLLILQQQLYFYFFIASSRLQ